MAITSKRARNSDKYKYVSLYITKDGLERWVIKVGNSFTYNTEKEAAMAVDLIFIRQGKSPVNILKPVN